MHQSSLKAGDFLGGGNRRHRGEKHAFLFLPKKNEDGISTNKTTKPSRCSREHCNMMICLKFSDILKLFL